ncbi:MAG: co-chaperone GroES [Chloroflexi bacterium]|nr:co-chaperone GroES [Chloroflexota bacterium]
MAVKTAFKVKPLGDRVVVRPIDKEEVTKSGLVLPDTAKEKPQEGEVLAVGPGRTKPMGEGREPMDVKAGDKVLYAKYAGAEVKLESETYLILGQNDILAILG